MKKLRQSTVDPVLGALINFMGMRRINTVVSNLPKQGMITITKSNQNNGQIHRWIHNDRNETTELTQKPTDLNTKYKQDQIRYHGPQRLACSTFVFGCEYESVAD